MMKLIRKLSSVDRQNLPPMELDLQYHPIWEADGVPVTLVRTHQLIYSTDVGICRPTQVHVASTTAYIMYITYTVSLYICWCVGCRVSE